MEMVLFSSGTNVFHMLSRFIRVAITPSPLLVLFGISGEELPASKRQALFSVSEARSSNQMEGCCSSNLQALLIWPYDVLETGKNKMFSSAPHWEIKTENRAPFLTHFKIYNNISGEFVFIKMCSILSRGRDAVGSDLGRREWDYFVGIIVL